MDQDTGPYEREPPNDLPAERATLGSMLLSRQAVLDVAAIIGPGDYYRPAHAAIHAAISQACLGGHAPDPIVVAQVLAADGSLARVGGAPYLHTLMQSVPSTAMAGHYARIVATRAQQRRLIEAGLKIQLAAQQDAPDLQGLRSLLATESEALARLSVAHTVQPAAIDWDRLISTDFGATEFITEPLLSPGSQIAVVGDGKVGKSLFCYEWALRLATGRPFLNNPPRPPIRVLYIDQENSHPELQRRLWTTGFDRDPAALKGLTYMSFASIGALDTQAGADDLMGLVDWAHPDVIFLDTISRMIQGEENSADTWLQLYRLSLRPLKDRGLACVRLDHFGKDRERGSRGSSAKTQDVDHVWEMAELAGGAVQMLRTHTRNGIGRGMLTLRREGSSQEHGTTTHVIVGDEEIVRSQFIIQDRLHGLLLNAGIPWSASNVAVRKALREMGEKVSNDMVATLVRWRQDHDPLQQEILPIDEEDR